MSLRSGFVSISAKTSRAARRALGGAVSDEEERRAGSVEGSNDGSDEGSDDGWPEGIDDG